MAPKPVTYTEYKECGGALDPEQFAAALPVASHTVGTVIGTNEVTERNRIAYCMAVSRLIERSANPTSRVESERVGDTTIHYGPEHKLSDSEFARQFLVGSGLLYTGV